MHTKYEMTTNNAGIPCIIRIMLEDNHTDTVMEIEDDIIKVELANIGEGKCGDYNPNDPDDVNFLRFYVYVANPDITSDQERNENRWEDVEDASYCTQIPADTPADELKDKIKLIHTKYRDCIHCYDDYVRGASVKKLGEELSWIH